MKQLNILTNYAKIILINDFMLDNNLEISGYIHRNWIDIMKNFDFDYESSILNMQPKIEKANPRALIFKNKNASI